MIYRCNHFERDRSFETPYMIEKNYILKENTYE